MANIAIGDKIESPVVYLGSAGVLTNMVAAGTASPHCIYGWPTYGASSSDYVFAVYDKANNKVRYLSNDGLEYKATTNYGKGLLPKLPTGKTKYFSGNAWKDVMTKYTESALFVEALKIDQWDLYTLYGGLFYILKFNVTYYHESGTIYEVLVSTRTSTFKVFSNCRCTAMPYCSGAGGNKSAEVFIHERQSGEYCMYVQSERGAPTGQYTIRGTLVASAFT